MRRVEDPNSGRVINTFRVNVPAKRYDETCRLVETFGHKATDKFPFVPGAQKVDDDPMRLILNRSWEPTFTVTGQTGFPQAEGAGNVMLPAIDFRFSLRIPPTLNNLEAAENLKKILT